MSDLHITVEHNPAAEDVAAVRSGLSAANLARVPALQNLLDHRFGVIVKQDEKPVGGALAWFDWGWLFVDTLWFEESVRGQGWGSRCLQAAESIAALYGIERCYLFTTSFQALDFYRKQGYAVVGTIQDRPPGHEMFVLVKHPLQLRAIDPRLVLEFPISEQTHEIVDGGLVRFNNDLIPTSVGSFAVFLRDASGTIVGAAVASTIWGWCDLMWMWVAESLRGQGWGTKLLDALHAECRRQGLWWIMTATNEFQALPFYQRYGYRVIAELPHFPPGYTHYFLQKRLKDE